MENEDACLNNWGAIDREKRKAGSKIIDAEALKTNYSCGILKDSLVTRAVGCRPLNEDSIRGTPV